MLKRHRVGIVGLEPGRSWAARAHLPALRALKDDYEVIGVANRSLESSQRAAAACNIPLAFASASDLAVSPEVDIVTITVKVPHHFELVRAAIEAGKTVYCEWPLGNGLNETEQLASLARAKGIVAVIGTQARVAPEVLYLRDLIAEGFVGEVLSTALVGCGVGWGSRIPDRRNAYILDSANGATMLTIPVGHTLAAVQEVLGAVLPLTSIVQTRNPNVEIAGTSEFLPMSAPDQIVVSGMLGNGAPMVLHYRGGVERDGNGFLWQINGTEGDIRISAAFGQPQMVPLSIHGARGDEKSFVRLQTPESYRLVDLDDPVSGNVARIYARLAQDLNDAGCRTPRFEDAVTLHRIIDKIARLAVDRVE